MAAVRFNLIDVFTDRAFAGNQLAVFTDARALTAEQMLILTREMHFSESTFVLPPASGGHARVRIFTPAAEIPFAGHPVLGTAIVLAGPMQLGRIELETGAGIIPVELEREGARIIFGRMQQPVPTWQLFDAVDELLRALGVPADAAQLPVEVYDNGVQHICVTLSTAEEVAALEPDLARLARVVPDGVSCFAVTQAAPPVKVKTRMFAPSIGVVEDPATGSAAGPIAVHLARHGVIPWGTEIEIAQGAEIGRPSTLFARATGGAAAVERVEVGGSAVVVGRGEIAI